MKRALLLPLVLLTFGCSQNYFNVPKDNFAEKVKVLGVVPLMVDADSDIRHPQKEQLITLVAEMNRTYEQQFVGKLKDTGNYYSVSLLPGDPAAIYRSLFFRREKRDDAALAYNKYFWKNDELREYIRRNNLDAVMLIVVSGLSKTDKIYSSTLLSSLTSEYNYLTMSAQILDANGTVLWEYPNFRGRLLTYYPMVCLQYPDFSEASANHSDKVAVKFKTFEGIRQILNEKRKDYLLRETRESNVYAKQFGEMLSLLKFDASPEKNTPAAAVNSVPAANKTLPGNVGTTSPVAAPPAPLEQPLNPSTVPTGGLKTSPSDAITVPSDEIVPATGR
jgi:hypothetical protein